jgi:hypothetical protein
MFSITIISYTFISYTFFFLSLFFLFGGSGVGFALSNQVALLLEPHQQFTFAVVILEIGSCKLLAQAGLKT